ncbi:MAG: PP0621 family protein [Pseudomonadota bacterium]
MGKLILLGVVILVVYWVLRGYRRSLDRAGSEEPRTLENMVRCAHCGLHVPRSESVEQDGRFFCSEDHRRIGGS